MKKILNSKFYTTVEVGGIGVYRKHNVTEYETETRQNKSPICMLAYLDACKLDDPKTKEHITTSVIDAWISNKIRSNFIFIIIWICIRGIFFTLFIVVDADIGWLITLNKTENLCPSLSLIDMGRSANRILIILILIFYTSTCLWDIYNAVQCLIQSDFRHTNLIGKKNVLNNILFYKTSNSILNFLITGSLIVYLYNDIHKSEYYRVVTDIARGLIPILILWSVVYYLQLTRLLGPSIISMQGMVITMSKFMVIFVIMAMPFIHAFENFFLSNSLVGCNDNFQNPFNTSYTLYHIILNIIDVADYKVENKFVLYMIEVLFTFTVGIMLLNFLIAVMSDKASFISDHQQIIVRINQLALISTMEGYLFKLKRIVPFYKQIRRSGFLYKNNNVYVKSVGNRFDELCERRRIEKQK